MPTKGIRIGDALGLSRALTDLRVMQDLPQTKREKDYRDQRDQLAQALRRVLKEANGGGQRDPAAEIAASGILAEIYGE